MSARLEMVLREQVVTLFEGLGVLTILPHGENIQVSCPFAPFSPRHKSALDKRPAMGIRVRDYGVPLVNCFACGAGGDDGLLPLIQRLQQHREVSAELVELARVIDDVPLTPMLAALPAFTGWSRTPDKDRALHDSMWEQYGGLWHSYWDARGVSKDTGRRWDVGYDRDATRVMVPVKEQGTHRLVGAVGRLVHDFGTPKYMNYWKFDKGLYLLGEHLAVEGDRLIVVEGCIDALAIDEVLPEGYSVVAALGAEITDTQIDKMIDLGSEVIDALDDDEAGRAGSRALAERLMWRTRLRKITFPSGVNDPGDLLESGRRDELLACVIQSKPVIRP